MFASAFQVNWSTPLLLLAIYGIFRYFVRPKNKDEKLNYTPLEAASVTLAIYFGSQVVAGILLYGIPQLLGVSGDRLEKLFFDNAYGQFVLALIINSLVVWLVYSFLRKRGLSFRNIGLKKPNIKRSVLYTLVGYGVYLVLYLAVLNIIKQAVPALDLNQPQDTGFQDATNLQLPLVFISIVIFTPIAEEILTRGFLYAGLKKGMHIVWAALITSGLFAVAHLQAGNGKPLLWTAAIDTFVLSLVLIHLKEKTGNLYASIGLHMLKNGIAFLSLFVFHLV